MASRFLENLCTHGYGHVLMIIKTTATLMIMTTAVMTTVTATAESDTAIKKVCQ